MTAAGWRLVPAGRVGIPGAKAGAIEDGVEQSADRANGGLEVRDGDGGLLCAGRVSASPQFLVGHGEASGQGESSVGDADSDGEGERGGVDALGAGDQDEVDQVLDARAGLGSVVPVADLGDRAEFVRDVIGEGNRR
jgi:hypothetical protein